MEQILLLTMITFIASVVQGVSGFAFGIILVGISQYILNYTTTLAFNSLLSTCMLLYTTYYYRKNINFSTVKYPILSACIMVLVTQKLFSLVASLSYAKAILGIIFVLLGLYMIYGSDKITMLPNKRNGLFCGTVTGLLQGLFGVGGPFITVYLLSVSANKKEYFGNNQLFFFVLIGVDFLGRLNNDLVPIEVFQFFPSCFLAMLAGFKIGTSLVEKVNMQVLQRLVHIIIILDGLYMIIYTMI